ncbi:MAG: SMC-Scp complex subunit ScpB [Clostridia bacterium]|nr:SMC-Scp complex subunit ScpB [Clostridia bacterium]
MSEEIKEAVAKEQAVTQDSHTEDEIIERVIVFEEALEAILFAAGHPITYATLARVFDTTPVKVKEKVIDYSMKYNNPEIPRGVILLTYGESCQLCTKQYYLHEIREALGIKKSGTLSTSSLEALAIVAYNQPVTRAFVDTLRRADSSYAMNNLIDRGLIESKGRLDAPGRPMLYGTTSDFLRSFGIKDIASLPRTPEEIQEMFAKAKRGVADSECIQEEIDFAEDAPAVSPADGETLDAISDMAGDVVDAMALMDNEPSAEDDIPVDD